jgi:hypothetical protein
VSSQRRSARTGQVASSPPNGTATAAPAPSRSVFERRIVSTTPLGLEAQVRDLQRDELAAAQRRRPADEQQRAIAQPRARSTGMAMATERAQGVELKRRLLRLRHAELAAGAANDRPHDVVVRRRGVNRRAVVDRAIAASLRAMVAGRRSRRVRSATYSATVSGAADRRARPTGRRRRTRVHSRVSV